MTAVPARSNGGVAYSVGAYLLWGMFPAFFGLLDFAGAVEILAHRILWTLAVMVLVMLVLGRLRSLRELSRKTWGLVALASLMIAINWGMYVYGVTSGHVVECALGYFINPLVSVLFGVIIFRERLVPAQIAAVAIAVAAVVVITVDYGKPPWIALTLACSFATYGLVKKVVPLDPMRSLTGEGIVAAPFALVYVIYLSATGTGTFGSDSWAHSLLLMAAGPITCVPLVLFGAAAQRVPLVTMGILQYLTPALQMAYGVAIDHEDMPASRWIGFAMIWVALAVFTADALRRYRKASVLGREP